jgi:hypothetical protein
MRGAIDQSVTTPLAVTRYQALGRIMKSGSAKSAKLIE